MKANNSNNNNNNNKYKGKIRDLIRLITKNTYDYDGNN